ncbi:MAG: DUF554 domain-containing protein [Clostridiales bacterium]|nr:DUF554 domain-containing protein [Clostridiales bacterium]MDO4350467.1 DUF554 domain-containing protein [Eubacteriales bacterium]MDY4008113.1 DUF554 domain-containing protein [Candidatus Limiplasma sp.]
MIGTLINCLAIVLGSSLGLLLRRGMKENISKTVMQGVGLSVILIGVTGAIETQNTLLVILSMVIGGVVGALIDIDAKMSRLGAWAQRKLTHNQGEENTFAKGFVTASLVYCVGAMAVVGALDSGIRGDHSTLIAKAALDGVTAVIFSSSLGIGVMLSAVPVLVYQGAIALLGSAVAPLLSNAVVTEMSAVGGLLIMGIGVNMLLDKDIKVANLLPAILIPFLYFPIYQLFVR